MCIGLIPTLRQFLRILLIFSSATFVFDSNCSKIGIKGSTSIPIDSNPAIKYSLVIHFCASIIIRAVSSGDNITGFLYTRSDNCP